MNIFKDLMIEIRDLVGGHSKTAREAMNDIRKLLFDDLQDQASEKAQIIVIGVSLRFCDFGYPGDAILATAMGTSVIDGKIKP